MRHKFEYHTFLHHSQTEVVNWILRKWFEYHTFLHHSQTLNKYMLMLDQFEYHTFLHHSQTCWIVGNSFSSLSTIHFYIILKHSRVFEQWYNSLSTIHFYIILKRCVNKKIAKSVWVPYIFTSFSNRRKQRYTNGAVWVPYIFTSFSNLKFKNEMPSPA